MRMFLRGTSLLVAACAAASLTMATSASAAEVEMTISIKDHKFDPPQLTVAPGTRVKLTVNNLDATAEEFESKSLNVEKVVAGNASAIVRLKPLAKGSYSFVGEYHEDTAKGVLVVE